MCCLKGELLRLLSLGAWLEGFIVEGSLFLRRGKDEYELFAQALGLALPGTTDSSTEEGFRSFEASGKKPCGV